MDPGRRTVAGCVSFLLLSLPLAFAQEIADSPKPKPDAVHSQIFWRPALVQGDDSLFGALADFGRRSDQDRVLRSRGLIRSLQFRYKNFTYERDFFHVYKGFRLRSFMDGKLDLGLYKHYFNQGLRFGPAGAYLPAGSNRIELMLRWNLNERPQ